MPSVDKVATFGARGKMKEIERICKNRCDGVAASVVEVT